MASRSKKWERARGVIIGDDASAIMAIACPICGHGVSVKFDPDSPQPDGSQAGLIDVRCRGCSTGFMIDVLAGQPTWVESLGVSFMTQPPPLVCDIAFWNSDKAEQATEMAFWKGPPTGPWHEQIGRKPAEVYERLVASEPVDGVEVLQIDQMIERVKSAFRDDFVQLDEHTWEAPGRGFRITTTPYMFQVRCAGMSGDELNKFIDIGLEFNCPKYDVAGQTRYVQ